MDNSSTVFYGEKSLKPKSWKISILVGQSLEKKSSLSLALIEHVDNGREANTQTFMVTCFWDHLSS